MKDTKRFLCMLIALIMVLCTLSACDPKDIDTSSDASGDSSADSSADSSDDGSSVEEAMYGGAIVDKFLAVNKYTEEQKADVFPLISLPDLSGTEDAFDGKNIEMNFDLTVDKLEIAGAEEALGQLGDISFSVENVVIEQESGKFTADIVLALAGQSLTINVAYDGKAIILKAPGMLEKPLVIKMSAVEELMNMMNGEDEELEDGGSAVIMELLVKFEANKDEIMAAVKEFFSEENLGLFVGLLADCIPTAAITEEKVTIDKFNFGYITNIETTCYTLTLNEEVAKEIAKNFVTVFKGSAEFKASFAKLYEVLKSAGILDSIEGAALLSGEAAYDYLLNKLAESMEETESSEESSEEVSEETSDDNSEEASEETSDDSSEEASEESSEDISDESSEEITDDEEIDEIEEILIKRYFYNDIAVKTAICVEQDAISWWNIYANSASESGFAFDFSDEDGENNLIIAFGATKEKAVGSLAINSANISATLNFVKDATSIVADVVFAEGDNAAISAKLQSTKTDAGSTFAFDISVPTGIDDKVNKISLTVENTKEANGGKSVIKIFSENIMDLQLTATYSAVATDKTVADIDTTDCDIIDTADALAELLGSFTGGMGEDDYYDEELIGTWILNDDGEVYSLTFNEDGTLVYEIDGGESFTGAYDVNDWVLTAFVMVDNEAKYIYYQNDYFAYDGALKVYLDEYTEVLTKPGYEFYDEELIGTWTTTVEGQVFKLTFNEDGSFIYEAVGNNTVVAEYDVNGWVLSVYAEIDGAKSYMYRNSDYIVYDDTLTIYLSADKYDELTKVVVSENE